jgi:hypothetical protein
MRRLPPTAYLGLLAMLAFNLMPFYWMVSSSLKDGVEVVSFPATLWPEKITLEAYSEIWLQAGFLSYFSWVAEDKEGLIGGVFRTQKDALRFALFEAAGDSACVKVVSSPRH